MKREKGKWEGAERRRYPRREVYLEIYYQHLDDFFYDYAINLSHGGLFIKTVRPIPVGTELKLRFAIPNCKEVIETRGKVVRVVKPEDARGHQPGMGIEFEMLTPKDIEMINMIWEEDTKAEEKAQK